MYRYGSYVEKTGSCTRTRTTLDFEEDRNRAAIQSRKMETSLKDVSKQLHQMKKRKESLEQRLAALSNEKENSKLVPCSMDIGRPVLVLVL